MSTQTEVNERTVENLREHGFAVIVFNPDELEGADPEKVSDRLIELGWDVIYDLKP